MKFRKKPVVIEAFQLTRATRESNADWPQWLHEAWNGRRNQVGTLQINRFIKDCTKRCDLEILTLEGAHAVTYDDWIIRGVKGELYACKPDIFAMTYEPARETEGR